MDHWMGSRNKLLSDDTVPSVSTIQGLKEFEVEVMTFKSPVKRSLGRTYSMKVFLGGLPPDVDEDRIQASFAIFGSVTVNWPGKSSSTYMFPPKGFAFLYFEVEVSVHRLIDGCWQNEGRLYYPVSSLSMTNKMVEVVPWRISDAVNVVDPYFFKKELFAAFIGGIPRRVTSADLTRTVTALFGGVSYIALSLDNRMSYPMGSGVVLFSNYTSYATAMRQQFVCLMFSRNFNKVIEFKPFQRRPNESYNNYYGKDRGLSSV